MSVHIFGSSTTTINSTTKIKIMTPTINLLLQKTTSLISKKLFVVAIATTCFTASAFAGGDDANAKAINNLKKEYSDAKNVQWNVTDDYIKATFKWNKQDLTVIYTKDGETFAESRLITPNNLPLKAQQHLDKNYSDYRIAEAIEFSSEETGLCYYVSVTKGDTKKILQISPQGNISTFRPSL
jgi:hypothetical protein